MNSKTRLGSALPVLVIPFIVFIFICLSGGNVLADDPVIPDLCGDNEYFTSDFMIDDCHFKTIGENPYFILKPGYQRVLVTPEGEEEREMSIETVLCETKTINLNGRLIKTRVYEERALEFEEGEGGEPDEWVTVEISRNWFAFCKETNAVYYFGEDSFECDEGFDDDETCEDGSDPLLTGSWEAGVDGAKPGIIMPGTFLLGAKYFQEIAPPDAVDRGENRAMGLDWPEGDPEYTDCVLVIDTNPTEGGDACGDDDAKTYCPGVGLVQDEDMELVNYGFAGCNNYLPDEEEEED
jgi:hypothetical protein